MDNITDTIRQYIIDSKPGTLFCIGDFTKTYAYENVKKSLQRIAKQEIIEKVVDGIYVKPQYSTILNKKVKVLRFFCNFCLFAVRKSEKFV